ncbi:DUF6095 family protein [uncultured Nonlabens sp.]|uniref:DUF6095 family protein n=1 Tax=uncultured Nonlabens sp. TaxID=859306 RepID=UPI00261A248C|nr:DUF6095 family protein [uncultured Nonlabens sp.]
MSQKSTDRKILGKGVKKLAISVLFLFAGPILIYIGAGSEHPIIYLMPGIAFAIVAVLFIFQGINLILDSMFKSNKTR